MLDSLNNLEKAAVMLVCLGVEKASQVLAHLSQDEVQMVAAQMARTGKVTGTLRREVLEELHQRYIIATGQMSAGGIEYVQRLLAETFGEERAALVLEELTQRRPSRPFSRLRNVESHRLLDILSSEHPGVIALVLQYLPRDKAASVLSGLPVGMRNEVVFRLVHLNVPQPQVVGRLEQLLAQKLSDMQGDAEDNERDIGAMSGGRTLVEILNRADPAVERGVYEFLQERDPVLAEEVRKSMFVFEDITHLEQRHLQLVLRELSSQELAKSMKGASEEIQTAIYSNVSENAAKMIREEVELLGPVRVSQVEEARQKVVATVRRLADEGVIVMRASDAEEMVA